MSPVSLKPPERVAVSKMAAIPSRPPADACVLMVGLALPTVTVSLTPVSLVMLLSSS